MPCKDLTPTPPGLAGTWYFAYIQKSQAVSFAGAPPRFDIITIGPRCRLKLQSTMEGMDVRGTFRLDNDTITFINKLPDWKKPVEIPSKWSLKDSGTCLVLSQNYTELVYYKKARLLDSTVAGTWSVSGGGSTETMELAGDGSLLLLQGRFKGFYRLWQSAWGSAMTTNIFMPGYGAFSRVLLYERNGTSLSLTPVGKSGPEKDRKAVWKLKE